MYRKLLASTALSLVIAGGAFAQETAPAPEDPMMEAPADDAAQQPAEAPQEPLVSAADRGINADGWLATEIIGENIYNSTAEDAETIGEVNDFVLDQNGAIGAVVVGVGGFLGIGQKNVAINWDDLELVDGVEGEQRLVANMTREQLENAAEFDRAEWLASERAAQEQQQQMDAETQTDPAADPMAPAPAPADDPAAAPADDAAADPAAEDPAAEPPADDAAADPAAEDPAAEAPADDATAEDPAADPAAQAPTWDQYEAVAVQEISADELTGTAVYGANDESIGDIGDVILSEDGQVEAVIIDFGGFLGIGTKPVAVSFENLQFLRDENGALILRTGLTQEDLEAAPEYNEDAYLQDPGQNTLMVQ